MNAATLLAIADQRGRAELKRLLVGRCSVSAGALAYVIVMHHERANAARFAAIVDDDDELNTLLDQMRAMLEAGGEGVSNLWPRGEGTPEFEASRDQANRRVDELKAQLYDDAGQPTLAGIVRAGRLILLMRNSAPIFARECVFNEV